MNGEPPRVHSPRPVLRIPEVFFSSSFEIPFWNIKDCFKNSNSSFVNWNIKSGGKRLILRFTALFRLPVVTSYNSAKSRSSITRWPRIS